jgi:two-component system, sensor histidine kinase and response regulator
MKERKPFYALWLPTLIAAAVTVLCFAFIVHYQNTRIKQADVQLVNILELTRDVEHILGDMIQGAVTGQSQSLIEAVRLSNKVETGISGFIDALARDERTITIIYRELYKNLVNGVALFREKRIPEASDMMETVRHQANDLRYHLEKKSEQIRNKRSRLNTVFNLLMGGAAGTLLIISLLNGFVFIPALVIRPMHRITEDLRSKEKKLQRSEARLRTITDSAQDAIVMMDPSGAVSYWNPAAEHILGYKSDEALDRDVHELIMPRRYAEDFGKSFPEFQKTGRGKAVGKTLELNALRKDGQEVVVSLALSAVSFENQWHAIGIMRDITEKRMAEETLRKFAQEMEQKNMELDQALIRAEEATRAKSEFLANMSHEIRTPLNGVIGMTELLLETALDEEQRRYAKTAGSSADHLLTVIDDILDFSKIEAGRMELENLDFDLEALLSDFGKMMAAKAVEKGLELICSMDLDVPSLVRGDPGRLRQILINMTGNAVKFTEHGEVEIRVSREQMAEEQERNAESGTKDEKRETTLLRFSIRDTGIGIPADKQDHLFQSFSQVDASTTRKYGGTGLGLVISRQLAALMTGEVGFTSLEGQGSTFWFTARLGLQEKEEREDQFPAHLQGIHALVVDDNASVREMLRQRLTSWGIRSQEAGDGPSALNMLYRALARGEPCHLALVDMDMPGMDGATLGRAIRVDERLNALKLVMMSSAMDPRDDSLSLRQAGFSGSLTKPFLHGELYASLDRALRRPDGEDTTTFGQDRETSRTGLPDFAGVHARILVAEDNLTNQQVVLSMLRRMHLEADAVTNGVEALNMLKSRPYDLVLMDVQMPEMDGLEATRQIRRMMNDECKMMKTETSCDPFITHHSSFRIPVIALTAGATQRDREKCFAAGMDDFVTKPVKPKKLGRILQKWLGMAPENHAIEHDQDHEEQTVPGLERDSGRDAALVFDRASMLEFMSGDEENARSIMSIFLQDMPDQMQSIRELTEQGDARRAGDQAHKIKGAAGNVGGMALHATAYAMETAGRSGDLEKLKSLLPELEQRFADLRKALILETGDEPDS